MSLVPGDSEPSQSRGGEALVPAAGKAVLHQVYSSQPHSPAALPPHCASNLPAKKTVNVLAASGRRVLG